MINPLVFVVLPIVSGLFIYIFKKEGSRYPALIVQGVLLGLSLLLLSKYHGGTGEQALFLLTGAPHPFGIALRYDELSMFFLGITNLLFFLTTLFDFSKGSMNYFFVFFFLSLQGLINAVFLSTDFFNLYVILEAATVVVTILVLFKKRIQAVYDGMIYLMMNMVAMVFFLFGLGFLYKAVGTMDFIYIRDHLSLVDDPQIFVLPLAFMMTALSVKSAVFPLFSWLPKAHGAPSAPYVVSAVLSGIFVMTGVYSMLRLEQTFAGAVNLKPFLFGLGILTCIAGLSLATVQKDIKLILAYSSVSKVGLILCGLYGANSYGYVGGLYLIFAHSIFKAMLFLVAGCLIGHYGTRRITDMTGLWQKSKVMAVAVWIGVFSITAAPFFNGGFSKYMIGYGYTSWDLRLLFWLIGIGTILTFLPFLEMTRSIQPSAGLSSSANPSDKKIHLSHSKGFVLIGMSAICLLTGLVGEHICRYLFGSAPDYGFAEQLKKLPEYLILFGGSVILYNKFLKKLEIQEWLEKRELSFNGMMIALSGFFVASLIYLQMAVR